MASLSVPPLSYAQRLGRAAVRTTDLSDSLREELFPIPRKFIDCGQVATNRGNDDGGPLMKNPDMPPDLQGQDIVQKLGFIEPAKPRRQNSLKKVLLYDNVTEQRRLELSLSKLSFEEKRFADHIAQRKAEILSLTAKDRAYLLYKKRHGGRPMSEPTHSVDKKKTSTRRIHFGINFHGRGLEASSFPEKPRSAGELLTRKPLTNLIKFPSISTGRSHNTLEYPSLVEDFSKGRNYFGDVTRKCLTDDRFRRLRDALIPPEGLGKRKDLEQDRQDS